MRVRFRNEKGLTGMSILFVLAVLAGVVTMGLRLFPLYNEKFQIVSALNTVANQPDAASFTTKTAGKAFMKAINVTNINRFTDSKIKENLKVIKPKKKGEPRVLHMQYEATNKFVADIDFLLRFDKKIPLTGPGGG